MTRGHGAGEARVPLERLSPCVIDAQASCRLLCFNSAGTGATVFRQWDRASEPALNVVGIQLPGREGRFAEPPARDVRVLTEQLGPSLVPLLDRPFALFGHSYGALVAFELARWLRRHGLPAPLHLFVAGRPAPQLPYAYRKTYDLPDAEFIDVLRQYGGTRENILADAKALRFFLPIIRADLEANTLYAYREEPPFTCGITAMRGVEDPVCEEGPLLAWREQTQGAFEHVPFAGAHFFHVQAAEPLLRQVEATLGPWLPRAGPRPSPVP
ncbi:thioesterase II family protein [Corallococcus coralloides]|uniref:thioesterase II family protein n=1 Tax=Corallococcus coralloides TaxID=184914 RepID=UPI0014307631|nr:alpha/beta fold hydrolase [Corallococcus coralloides]